MFPDDDDDYGSEKILSRILFAKALFNDFSDFVEVEIVGTDPRNDIAVLKVSSKQSNPAFANPLKLLPMPIPKGSSRFLQVGQTCLALGRPEARSNTLTVGTVSALNKEVTTTRTSVYGCIQTHGLYKVAASAMFMSSWHAYLFCQLILFQSPSFFSFQHLGLLAPGNSGGPLLDSQGRVIGINFSMNNNSNLGNAVPVDTAKRVVSQIIQNGQAEVALPGISLISDELQEELELQKGHKFGGVLIKAVASKSPADDAGLQGCVILTDESGSRGLEARDLIVGVDGQKVTSGNEFFALLRSKFPGEQALISVSRLTRIGELKRWIEVIPVKLLTVDELCNKSEEFRMWTERD